MQGNKEKLLRNGRYELDNKLSGKARRTQELFAMKQLHMISKGKENRKMIHCDIAQNISFIVYKDGG